MRQSEGPWGFLSPVRVIAVRSGEVSGGSMHPWSPLNERQRGLLGRLSSGEGPESWKPGDWRSAYALRDRGLLSVRRDGGVADVQVTEAGAFYLRSGHHPDDPAHRTGVAEDLPDGGTSWALDSSNGRPGVVRRSPPPYSERPVARARRAQATELVERLVAEGRVVIRDPDEAEAAEWRRAIDYAKRHGLEPRGKRIEKTRVGRRGWELHLATGPHANSRGQSPSAVPGVRTPEQLRALHPAVRALRDDEQRLVMPAALRRRALLLFQGLVGEAVRRGHEVRDRPGCSWRAGEVDVVVEGFASTVTIRQEFPQSADPDRSGKLVIELGHCRSGGRGRWGDRKRWVLEDVLGAVLKEIENRSAEDARRRAGEEQAKAQREVRWRAAVAEAKDRAVRAQLAEALREQAGCWHEATLLDGYCDALERRIVDGADAGEAEIEAAKRWLAWARQYVRVLDPLSRLPSTPTPRDPTPDELKPYLQGWNASDPEVRRFGWGGH